jgi:RHS repeat-associated protein
MKSSGGTVLSTDTYSYDGAGNMTAHNGNTYSYNQTNERTGTGNTYDQDGNVTAEASGPSFSYNARNQTKTITPSGGSAVSFNYLGLGQNELMDQGSVHLHYGRLGLQSREDTDDFYYTRTPNGELVGIAKDDGTTISARYPLFDQLGSIVGQTGSSGTVARNYSYDPYGNRTITGGTAFDDSLGYVQGLQTTANLVHFGARLYEPATGRWTQMDPLGSDAASLRLTPIGASSQDFAYAGDDPINTTDMSGEIGYAPCLGKKKMRCPKPGSSSLPSAIRSGGKRVGSCLQKAALYGVPLMYATAGDSLALGCIAGGLGF